MVDATHHKGPVRIVMLKPNHHLGADFRNKVEAVVFALITLPAVGLRNPNPGSGAGRFLPRKLHLHPAQSFGVNGIYDGRRLGFAVRFLHCRGEEIEPQQGRR